MEEFAMKRLTLMSTAGNLGILFLKTMSVTCDPSRYVCE